MDDQDLRKILCHLKPGMSLTVPDEWIDQNISGPPARRASRVKDIASEYSCVHKHGMGVQTFERFEYPRLG